jgi:hypothetical protein
VRNPLRLFSILLLPIFLPSLYAQQILVLGVKQAASCRFATRPLIADLEATPYPNDWTIVVACTRLAWEQLQRRADAMQTHTAFTNLRNRITAINGEIYRDALPLQNTVHHFPRLVLQHELGHVLCQCNRESEADHSPWDKLAARVTTSPDTGRQRSTFGPMVGP